MLSDADGPGSLRIATIQKQREALSTLLAELGVEILPSQGSFVFAHFADAAEVWSSLHALGIAIRAFHGRPDVEGWLRITLPGDGEAFDRLTHALRTVLAPEALLFDMDGVLADVSGSYREATLRTAASFGIQLRPEDIEAETAAGNTNNDWELTRRLMAARGVERPLDEVTARFEEIYQGTDAEPGLRRTERLLVSPTELRALAERMGIPNAESTLTSLSGSMVQTVVSQTAQEILRGSSTGAPLCTPRCTYGCKHGCASKASSSGMPCTLTWVGSMSR